MWCNVCQSDVAIEVGADHRRVTCSTCGTVLGETAVSRENEQPSAEAQGGRVTEARDLLDRWASNHLFDPYGPPKKPVSGEQVADRSAAGTASSGTASSGTASSDTASSDTASSDSNEAAQSAPPERLEDLLEPSPPGIRPRWDAAHTTVRRPMNLDRRDEGLRGSRPAEDAGGGVAESSRRPHASPSQRPPQPPVSASDDVASDSESTGGAGLAASAAELDRLTNEILSRVSRIANQRSAEPPAVEQPINEQRGGDVRDAYAAADYDNEVGHDAGDADSANDDEQPTEAGDTWNLAPAGRPVEPAPDDDSGFADSDDSAASNVGRDDEQAASRRRVPRPHAAAFTQRADATHRVDTSHRVTEPHADFAYRPEAVTVENSDDAEEDAANWFGGIGQGLAWLGILGLTAGTSLVIVGYFGGPTTYAPMGWLISTIGQMLLFLGIVTLVSSGMEQTTQEVRRTVNEVSRKLDLIEDRIIRIDAAEAPGPPRPHIADRMVNAVGQQHVREEAARR